MTLSPDHWRNLTRIPSIRPSRILLTMAVLACLAITVWSIFVQLENAAHGATRVPPATAQTAYVIDSRSHKPAVSQHAAPRHRRPRGCEWHSADLRFLPSPEASYEVHYVPPRCDPLHKLPKQAWRMLACVRWREAGDQPTERNSAGSAGFYQFQDGTWLAFGGGQFAPQAQLATPVEQDRVAYRAYRAEQFYPWRGDPCLNSISFNHTWGWWNWR